MIFAYNPQHVGDTLLVITDNDQGLEQSVERKENVARIQTEDGRVVGWNFFHISEAITLEGNGQVTLSDEQVATLNQLMAAAGFADQLTADHEAKFVVGFVKSCEPHEDSDHLSITEIEVDGGETLQIVCGAPNIRKGLKVVVAKPGAMMPDGMMIWPGELRGVASYGMICSAKELKLPNAPMKRGILELGNEAVVGEAFAVGK
ncbi:YtpR family tRNA-binding protein [Enterococcus olivae]